MLVAKKEEEARRVTMVTAKEVNKTGSMTVE